MKRLKHFTVLFFIEQSVHRSPLYMKVSKTSDPTSDGHVTHTADPNITPTHLTNSLI